MKKPRETKLIRECWKSLIDSIPHNYVGLKATCENLLTEAIKEAYMHSPDRDFWPERKLSFTSEAKFYAIRQIVLCVHNSFWRHNQPNYIEIEKSHFIAKVLAEESMIKDWYNRNTAIANKVTLWKPRNLLFYKTESHDFDYFWGPRKSPDQNPALKT